MFLRLLGLLFALGMFATGAAAQTQAPESAVRQLWQLLDYVGVDYGGAVSGGKVQSASEYAEMQDFTANALKQAQALPPQARREQLVAAITQLRSAVDQRADAVQVAALARQAGELLLAAYPVPVAPKALPDLQRAASLYQAQCAACHGATGKADTPMAASLNPPPVAFTDRERARSRSLLALYQVVGQGVEGTSMPKFDRLSDEDRWALAFYVGNMSFDASMREHGAALWKNNAAARAQIDTLGALTTATEAKLAQGMGADTARDLLAYARSAPQEVVQASPSGLALARSQLQRSLAAAQAGDSRSATTLALSAYLDGFEPLEPMLNARNPALRNDVETQMLAYRAALSSGRLDDASARAQDLNALFDKVQAELGEGQADPTTTFLGALTILLREGVEALLVVVGMLAFLRKAERKDVIPYVNGGWIAALAAGGATWAVATYMVGISGASREVTEGLSSLFAALILLGVGLWMHQKSSAGRWQAYLHEKLSSAMSKRSAWGLFALSFIAVYREVFETILFYSALAVDGHHGALLGGLLTGVALLAVLTWVLLKSTARMPIGKFFSISSIVVAVLAVVLAGKGVAALQEAGWLAVHPLSIPRIEALGIFPSAQPLAAQVLVLVVAVLGFARNAATARRPRPVAAQRVG